MRSLILKRLLSTKQADALNKKFIGRNYIKQMISDDCDGYDVDGGLLFKLRKNIIPIDLLKSGYHNFKESIKLTNGRGAASGHSDFRIFKGTGNTTRNYTPGQKTGIKMGNYVESGNVGFMDRNAMIPYCRTTAFARDYFDKFEAGLPFVKYVDDLYRQLCPSHYAAQHAVAGATNRNYVIRDTAFTTITVNKNFQTACHKDSGDFMNGMGNLCVYREGKYDGCFFVLPEYGAGFDMRNGDMLFVDVHKYHGNTPFENASEDYLRISFVMYYRDRMIECKQPTDELNHVKFTTGNFFKL